MKFRSAVKGDNSDLMKHVIDFYASQDNIIVDVTYGKGVFWRKIDLEQFQFYAYDLHPAKGVNKGNFTRIKHDDASVDIVVLDPPYMHTPGKPLVDERYKNSKTSASMYNYDILNKMYFRPMVEALRVLKPMGLLLVKCQDEIQSGVQKWTHCKILDGAERMGFYAKDLAILIPDSVTPCPKQQLHLKKSHSYLWVLQKPDVAALRTAVFNWYK